MEIEINSNDHKISNNKLRYYFNDTTKFENNSVSLMECIFNSYFENIKSNYSMKVRKVMISIIFFIKELNKYNNKTMGQSNIMKYRMQKAT